MSEQIISRLRIVLITYNRAQFLYKTLSSLLADESPVKNCMITILDNRSSDSTPEVIAGFARTHTNVGHVVNNFNVGGNANIVKALERCSTDYHWVLCDDDAYDWSAWSEVESAIDRGEKLICVGDRHLPKIGEGRRDPAQQLQQMTFLPSIIYGPGVITETALRNAYDISYALFPHLAPVVMHLNLGGKIHTISHGVVRPGEYETDISYCRGYDKSKIFPIGRNMVLSAGFAYLMDAVEDKKLAKRAYKALVFGSQMGRIGFYGEVFARLRGRDGKANFQAILRHVPFFTYCALRLLRPIQNSFVFTVITSPSLYRAVQRLADWRNRRAREHL